MGSENEHQPDGVGRRAWVTPAVIEHADRVIQGGVDPAFEGTGDTTNRS
jgi:hypothetical protein